MGSDDKKKIQTSALDQDVIEDINRRLDIIEKIKSTKVRRSSDEPKKEDVEELPLPEVDSLIGYAVQGDAYHNDLELLRDRIVGEASAPEFVSPRLQIDEEEARAREQRGEVIKQVPFYKTPSPLERLDNEPIEEGSFESLFFDEEEGDAAKEEMILTRDSSPEPEILGGFSLESLEALESHAAQHAVVPLESLDTQAEGPEQEMIVHAEEEPEEGDDWDLEEVQDLMDFKTSPGGEFISEEATVVDGIEDPEGGS